jgi:heme/copper-type cytochrome/quinol oxidase subunit 2
MVVLVPRTLTRRSWLLAIPGILGGWGALVARARTDQAAQTIDITVERFSFTPSEFRVKTGVPVDIRLRSEDTDHGFRILGTDINVTIPKRGKGVATVTFQPPRAGRYVFECSKLCGAGHSFMRGTLIAE